MMNPTLNNNTPLQPQKTGARLFRRLFFNARGKLRYWLIGGLAGASYGIASNLFSMIGIQQLSFFLFLVSLLIIAPFANLFHLSRPSELLLIPSFTPIGSVVFAIIYLSLHAGLGAVVGVLLGYLPSRRWRYAMVLFLLILSLGFTVLAYYAQYVSTHVYRNKMMERADDRGVALENSAAPTNQNEAQKQEVQIVNKTTEFLDDAVQYGKAEIILKDIHALWGGQDMRIYQQEGVDAWRADARVVEPGGRTYEYDAHFADTDIENVFALFVQEDFLSIELPQNYTPVPDDSLTSIALINGRGEPFTVQKWQTQPNASFDRIYQYLLNLEKKVRPI